MPNSHVIKELVLITEEMIIDIVDERRILGTS